MSLQRMGPTQRSVLQSLNRHGGVWHGGCGWIWDTAGNTDRVLRSMVKRGFVQEMPKISCYNYGHFRITAAGRTEAERR